MNSPIHMSRQDQQQGLTKTIGTAAALKSPLSPSNADMASTKALANAPPIKGTNAETAQEAPHVAGSGQNSENKILNSVALLIDSLKLDDSHQQQSAYESIVEEGDGDGGCDHNEFQNHASLNILDNVSPLASPAVSPSSQNQRNKAAAPPPPVLDPQTLMDVAKFVQMLRTNEKTAPVGQELDDIVKSMSEESMECAPKVSLSPQTLEALGLFIDHLSKNEAKKRETMPPTRVYVPVKHIQQASNEVNPAPLDQAAMEATPKQSEQLAVHAQQDLDPDALSILGRYIDAVAATPKSALSHWGIDPPSLRRGESEIVFQVSSQETDDDGMVILPDAQAEGQEHEPASSLPLIEPIAMHQDMQLDSEVFTFESLEESAPRAPSPRATSTAGTRERQEPGGASAHTVGMTEQQRREELDWLPALASLRVTADLATLAPPLDAPTNPSSLVETPKQDPPLNSTESIDHRRSSGEAEVNLNRQYWTEGELKLFKMRVKPESPRKKSMKTVSSSSPVCSDPVLSSCGLNIDNSGEPKGNVSTNEEDCVHAALNDDKEVAVSNDVLLSVLSSCADELAASVHESSSLLAECRASRHTHDSDDILAVPDLAHADDPFTPASSKDTNTHPLQNQDEGKLDNEKGDREISPLRHHVSWEDEKKVDEDPAAALQSDETTALLCNLYKILTDNGHPSNVDLDRFRTLISVACPFYEKDRRPTAVERARIQVQARRKHVPIVLTNAFLESLQTLSDTEKAMGIQQTPSTDAAAPQGEKIATLLNRVLVVKQAESSRDVVIYSLAGVGSQEGEAVEVDLHGHFGFARKDYGDADEVMSDGEPWWEAAARLVRQSKERDAVAHAHSVDQPPASLWSSSEDESTFGESSTKKPISIDDDIKGFWRARKQQTKRKYGRAASTKRWQVNEQWTTSYSATENESSLRTKSSSSSGFSAPSFGTTESLEEEWIRKRSYALWPKKHSSKLQMWMNGNTRADVDVSGPNPINAVNSVRYLDRPSILRQGRPNVPGTKQWKRTYDVRTQAHSGYFDVDVNSLYVYSAVCGRPHRLDKVPWERRDVKQRFLFEQSISYNRNWFGAAHKVYGNDTIVEPICFPRSMEMPTKAEVWTDEWYTKPVPTLLSQSTGASKDAEEMAEIRRKYLVEDEFDVDPDTSQWEENPECGKIRNVRLKIGERLSRVTPDLTSSLRRSRWRKKYFPKGTFPY